MTRLAPAPCLPQDLPVSQKAPLHTLMAWADDLPFAPGGCRARAARMRARARVAAAACMRRPAPACAGRRPHALPAARGLWPRLCPRSAPLPLRPQPPPPPPRPLLARTRPRLDPARPRLDPASPFGKPLESVDYIISLHNLEHLEDPVRVVLHYLSLLKPGGGLGIVIPTWQYAWRAQFDGHAWGHRWNTAPEVRGRGRAGGRREGSARRRGAGSGGGQRAAAAGSGQRRRAAAGAAARWWEALPRRARCSNPRRLHAPPADVLPPPPRAPPQVVCELHALHWAHLADLEALNTYPDFRLSFDFVLRKHGAFVPFNQTAPAGRTGKQMFEEGTFLGPVSRRARALLARVSRRGGGRRLLMLGRAAA
jgi:SAM-dependent methyltransferase